MDLAKRVDYEFLFDLELLDPATDEPLGIHAKLRSAGSDAAKRVLRAHTDRGLERRIKGKLPKSAQLEQEALEECASYIASWDWGDHTWNGEQPDMTDMKSAVKVLDEGGWIFAQIREAANKVENFSTASAKNSPKP